MAVSSLQRPSLSIPVTPIILEQIQRVQALNIPYARYEERFASSLLPNAPIVTRIYLIECFTLRNKPDRDRPSLTRVNYTDSHNIAPSRIIAVPIDISVENRRIIELATDLLAHRDCLTENLKQHLIDDYCDHCASTTYSINQLGAYISSVAASEQEGDWKEFLKKQVKVILNCSARRENLFEGSFLERMGVSLTPTIREINATPYLQDLRSRSGRSSLVMRSDSVRSGRLSTAPYVRPLSRTASTTPSRPPSGQGVHDDVVGIANCIRPVPLSPKKA